MKEIKILVLAITLFSLVFNYNSTTFADSHNGLLNENPNANFQKYSTTKLLEDIDVLVDTIDKSHPNAYFYMGKDKFFKEVKNVKERITQPMDSIEFYKIISPLIALLRDGHTCVLPPGKLFETYMDNVDGKLLPLVVEVRDKKIYNIESLDKGAYIPEGAKILSINDVKTEEIVETLTKYIPGMKPELREAWLEEEIYFLLWLHYDMLDEYKIAYEYNNSKFVKEVKGISKGIIDDYFEKKLNDEGEFSYTIIDGNICYLDFNRFKDYNSFKILLEEMFKEIKESNIENLIIDIRNNPGGNSILGDLLISYIYDQPFSQVSRIDTKLSEYITKIDNGYTGKIMSKNSEYTFNTEIENRFNGRVCVLIDRKSFSGATMFASTIKDYNIGVLIGEETGGLASQYGNIYHFRLPNSGLESVVSYKYFIRPNGEEIRKGVVPDFKVEQPLEDRINNKDSVLQFAKEFISNEYDTYYNSGENGVGEHIKYVEIIDKEDREELINIVKTYNKDCIERNYDAIYESISDMIKKDITIGKVKSLVDKREEQLYILCNLEDITFDKIYGIKENDKIINYYIEGTLNFEKGDCRYRIQLDMEKKIYKENIDA